MEYSGMNEIAETNGFAVCYPHCGIGLLVIHLLMLAIHFIESNG